VEVTTDISVTKQVPVQADWTGALAPNLIMTKMKTTPESLQIVGPRVTMDEVSTVYTEKISLDKITKSGSISVPLSFDPATFINLAPQAKGTVTVEYTVKEREPM
jgi:YbbR domain-containing protein